MSESFTSLRAIILRRSAAGDDSLALQTLLENGQFQWFRIPGVLKSNKRSSFHYYPGAVYRMIFRAAADMRVIPRSSELLFSPFGENQSYTLLNAVAERVKWGTPAPDMNGQKVFRGLAQTHGFGSYVAACAEVSVSNDGVLKVHRIVAATDPGYAVNPQQIEAQVEGSFAYGLSAALFGECTVKDGRMEQENFNTYQVVKMNEMPRVETIDMPSGGFWGGVGEPTIAVAAPAVLNAIFAATGKRIRDLPLKNHSLKRA